MADTVFWHIFNDGEWIEYHCSSVKQEVMGRRALSKKIKVDNPQRCQLLKEWHDIIGRMGNIMVEV